MVHQQKDGYARMHRLALEKYTSLLHGGRPEEIENRNPSGNDYKALGGPPCTCRYIDANNLKVSPIQKHSIDGNNMKTRAP